MILLDTSTWIWLTSDPDNLSRDAAETIDSHDRIQVSAISAWEIGMLVATGRVRLDRPTDRWVDDAMSARDLIPAPIDHRIAVLATQLPASPPADPADRLLIATALTNGWALVTPDRALRDYPFCPTIW